jgi:hypothetical protein
VVSRGVFVAIALVLGGHAFASGIESCDAVGIVVLAVGVGTCLGAVGILRSR